MKHFYKILLSTVCLMLSFTLTSEQKTPLKLNAVEITDTDSETDGDTIADNDPDNYVDQPVAYGTGPATNEGCSVTTVD